jgi:hypothetical protein
MGFIIFIILIYSILYNIYTIYMIDKDLGGVEGLSLLSGRLSYLSHIYGGYEDDENYTQILCRQQC